MKKKKKKEEKKENSTLKPDFLQLGRPEILLLDFKDWKVH